MLSAFPSDWCFLPLCFVSFDNTKSQHFVHLGVCASNLKKTHYILFLRNKPSTPALPEGRKIFENFLKKFWKFEKLNSQGWKFQSEAVRKTGVQQDPNVPRRRREFDPKYLRPGCCTAGKKPLVSFYGIFPVGLD